jgi:hypothetical protein
MRIFALSAAVWLSLTGLAAAQAPTAIVESTKGQVSGAESMDYVKPGQVIKLGASGTIVLAYLNSCVRETITGGVAIVGTDESRVSLGEVSRDKPMCGGSPAMQGTSSSGAGMVFRGRANQPAPQPRVTVFSLTPMIDVAEPGKLVIERTDKPGERHEATLTRASLVKDRFYDLASADTQLKPGGVYLATIGSRKVLFKVDQLAQPAGPLVGRLVRF